MNGAALADSVRGVTSPAVRRAGLSDVDALVDLRAHMFAAMGAAAGDPAWQANARTWFTDRIADPDYCLVVIAVEHTVVACAVGAVRDVAPSPSAPQGRDILVNNVSTHPDFRGRGYGRLAFEAVMAWARESGVQRAELMATEVGRGMYERAGFRATAYPAMRAHLH